MERELETLIKFSVSVLKVRCENCVVWQLFVQSYAIPCKVVAWVRVLAVTLGLWLIDFEANRIYCSRRSEQSGFFGRRRVQWEEGRNCRWAGATFSTQVSHVTHLKAQEQLRSNSPYLDAGVKTSWKETWKCPFNFRGHFYPPGKLPKQTGPERHAT